jgi:hypothetical protein
MRPANSALIIHVVALVLIFCGCRNDDTAFDMNNVGAGWGSNAHGFITYELDWYRDREFSERITRIKIRDIANGG